jgi:hypothetical protein
VTISRLKTQEELFQKWQNQVLIRNSFRTVHLHGSESVVHSITEHILRHQFTLRIIPPYKPQIKELHINARKRRPFTLLTQSNSSIILAINCKNCTKYVGDQKVSMCYGTYTTKHSTDCVKALAEAMLAIEKHETQAR